MILKYDQKTKFYYCLHKPDEKYIPANAGFKPHLGYKCYVTKSPFIAYKLQEYADKSAIEVMDLISKNIKLSFLDCLPNQPDNGLLPFQHAGVNVAIHQFKVRNTVLLGDDPGLGKTIQALSIANKLNAKKLLIVVPAQGRVNWVQEAEKWHIYNNGMVPIFKKTDKPDNTKSLVTSYELLETTQDYKPDLTVIDEAHFIKNPNAKRTGFILNNLLKKSKVLLMSGTIAPNGKPHEMYNILSRCAPYAIDGMSYYHFLNRFCDWYIDDYGNEKIKGPKNEEEFSNRLRGSGFMIRRLKKDVLESLPRMYKLAVLTGNAQTDKIIKQEKQFSAAQILENSNSIGGYSATLRREMGIAKVPVCVPYLVDLLNKEKKIVIFSWHLEVSELLKEYLNGYNPVILTGKTPAKKKQEAKDRFQNDPACRVFIGNIRAGGTVITLTASSNIVMMEPSWVPGEDEQAICRIDRISQTKGVLIHYPVIDGSLDALILKTMLSKRENVKKITD